MIPLKIVIFCIYVKISGVYTVDGRNFSSVDVVNIVLFTGFHTRQAVSRISEPSAVFLQDGTKITTYTWGEIGCLYKWPKRNGVTEVTVIITPWRSQKHHFVERFWTVKNDIVLIVKMSFINNSGWLFGFVSLTSRVFIYTYIYIYIFLV